MPEADIPTEKLASGDDICPRCGKPLHGEDDYHCECPDRWEDEGGAVSPLHE